MDPRSGHGTLPWLIVFAVIAMAPGVFCPAAFCQPIEWQEMNDGMWGGGIKKIVPGPGQLLYALTYQGGSSADRVYRSRNNGASWQELDTGAPAVSVGHLVVFPDGEIVATRVGGMMRSYDDGDNWESIPDGFGFGAGLVLHPAGTLFGSNYTSTGLYSSSDRGQSWQMSTVFPDTNSWIRDLDVTPLGALLVATGNDEVFRSDDFGETWSEASLPGSNLSRITVTADSAIYLLLGPPRDVTYCMYRSFDDGLTWQGFTCRFEVNASDIWVHGIAVTESGALVMGEGWRILTSTDDGGSWVIQADLPLSAIVDDSILIDDGTIHVGTWGRGILASDDDGETWTRRNDGIGASVVSAILAHPDGTMYAMGRDDDLYRSDDHGETWASLKLDPDLWLTWGSSLAVDSDRDLLLPAGDVYRSVDGGISWKRLHYSCSGEKVVVAPDGALYMLSYNQIVRYNEATDRCDEISSDLQAVHDLAFANNGDILVATGSGTNPEGDGVFRSSDGGVTWQAMPMPSFSKSINELLVKPDGVVIAGPVRSGIYRSEDDGFSFDLVWQPPYVGYVSAFVVGPVGEVYAATIDGIYRSMDDGKNWESVGQGIPEDRMQSMEIDAAGYLYVGTEGAGVYRTVKPVAVSAEHIDLDSERTQHPMAYPNPFSGSTTIRFALDKADHVQLTVHDAMGRLVEVVTQGIRAPGIQEVTWEARNRANGTYFFRLQVGLSVASGSLIVVR